MPRFEVKGPDGKRYEVQAPTAEAAANAVRNMGGQAPQAPSAQAPRPEPTVSRTQATLEGVGDSATFGFGDEIGAALDLNLSDLSAPSEAYRANLERRRGSLEKAQEERPGYTMGGQVGGALLTAPVLPIARVAQGASIIPRMIAGAKSGALYGGAYGAGSGEGAVDRGIGAATGVATGAAAGAAAPLAVRGVQAGMRGIKNTGSKVLAQPFRGAFNTDKEAARRIGIADRADRAVPQDRLTAVNEAAAVAAGQPIRNIDRSGRMVRDLGKTAANASPAARAELRQPLEDRFEQQGDRITDAVHRIVGGSTSVENRSALEQAARVANRGAYGTAYTMPSAQGLWDEGFEQMAQSPIVQNAMRIATMTGRNDATLGGFPPMRNPFKIDKQTGGLSLNLDERGNAILPSLQYWDHVHRALQDMARRGDGQAHAFNKVLLQHLDDLVPEFKTARAGAAEFFGAGSALEAGEDFVVSRIGNDEARQYLAKMKPPERQLFSEGFADRFVRMVREIPERRSVLNATFLNSRAARERIEMALGPQKARELEIFLRVEDLMDRARQVVQHGSPTAQYLVDLGLVGTGAGYGYLSGDPTNMFTALTIGGALTKAGGRRINQRVMERVAQMLASEDPAVFQRGVQMIAKDGRILDALRKADIPVALGATQGAVQSVPKVYLNAGERDRMMGAQEAR